MSAPSTFRSKNERICPHKYAFMLDNFIRRLFQHPKKVVAEYIREGDTVIDLGCGPGYFSIDMAKMVGENGRVIAVDQQESMLASVKKKAAKYGVADRIDFHRCSSSALGLTQKADFVLAMYMVHETPDSRSFLHEVKGLLKDRAKFLVVEPGLHVSRKQFGRMVKDAEAIGFRVLGFPKKKGGKSVLLTA
ncbi:class I SAM-dependent methyltransferase [Thermodesulfobacteriota bacterium]